VLNIKQLDFNYHNIKALEDIGLNLNRGEVLSLVGPNGSGKTTLLKCINRIVKPKKGSIFIDGKDTSKMNSIELAKQIGYVPQATPSKFPMTVFDAVLMGRRPYISWRPTRNDLDIVAQILNVMNLKDMALRDFDQLSGGEKQKVLLARAFAQDPEILLLDEPTNNLDLRHQIEIMELISLMVKEKNISAIMAMHDLNLASRFSDRMVLLKSGRIFSIGNPHEVITSENIRSVYGIEVQINKDNNYPYMLPVKVADERK